MNTILKRNQIVPIFTTLLLLLSLFSCSEEELPAGAKLSLIRQNLRISTTSIYFGYITNLSATINIEGENASWKLENLPRLDYCLRNIRQRCRRHHSQCQGPPKKNEARAAVIIFTSTSDDYQFSRTIHVKQFNYSADSEGHEWVDLGLPSGTLWATCNVGANSSEEYGDYFAWGETAGYNSGKRQFYDGNYKYCNGSWDTMTKYCTEYCYTRRLLRCCEVHSGRFLYQYH